MRVGSAGSGEKKSNQGACPSRLDRRTGTALVLKGAERVKGTATRGHETSSVARKSDGEEGRPVSSTGTSRSRGA